MPNLYYTRDPFSTIINGVSINKMYHKARQRETIFGEYIVKYHKDYKNTSIYYNRYNDYPIEGGDILVLSNNVLAIGLSERTSAEAIEFFFSSRRRHTSWTGDWSSDVCSSD